MNSVVSSTAKPKRVHHARGFDLSAAHAHLGKCDRRLATWMRRVGAPPTAWQQAFQPVDALSRAILFQQLSTKAAATIVGRVEKMLPGGPRFTAPDLNAADPLALRACGVSQNKILALKDLAAKAREGIVPDSRGLARMSDAEIIERLTAVRGIGRWTVEMMLIFRLGRPDILPTLDLGVQKGAQIVHGLETTPKPQALAELGERWGPYRTLASLYLWRVVHFERGEL